MAIDPITAINSAAGVAGTVGALMPGEKTGLSRQDQKFIAHENLRMANDSLYNGISIRTRDAVAAGLHPLAAIGAMPSNSTSVSANSGSSGGSLGDRLQNMSQNVSRAVSVQQSMPQRAILQAQLENAKAEGDFIRAQTAESLARAKNLSLPPPYPTSQEDRFGFSSTGDVKTANSQVFIRNPDGSISAEQSPQYGSTLYHRPISSSGRDFWSIVKDALRGANQIFTNTMPYGHKTSKWRKIAD